MQALEGDARLAINLSASPYHAGKGQDRERMIATRAEDNAIVVAYCNLVGGQDELVFDGQSLIVDEDGQLLARGAAFEEELLVIDLPLQRVFEERLHDPRRRKGRDRERRRAAASSGSTWAAPERRAPAPAPARRDRCPRPSPGRPRSWPR